jgi:hypothetical protein
VAEKVGSSVAETRATVAERAAGESNNSTTNSSGQTYYSAAGLTGGCGGGSSGTAAVSTATTATAAVEPTDDCERSVAAQDCPMRRLELEHDGIHTTTATASTNDDINATEYSYDNAVHSASGAQQYNAGATNAYTEVNTAGCGINAMYQQVPLLS